MKPLLSLLCALLLSACATSTYSDYTIDHYIAASNDNSIAQWRQRENIPPYALIAVYPDGHIAIVENPTRTRYIGPSMNPYVNDFVTCYLNMDGTYLGQPVTLQAPCDRDPERFRYFGMEPYGSTYFYGGFGYPRFYSGIGYRYWF